jgi:hypothetical protein
MSEHSDAIWHGVGGIMFAVAVVYGLSEGHLCMGSGDPGLLVAREHQPLLYWSIIALISGVSAYLLWACVRYFVG